MRRIFVYISSVLLCLVLITTTAQKKKNIIIPKDSTRWLNGFMVRADLAAILSAPLSNNVSYSTEAGIQLDLKHTIFPCFELGVGGANKNSLDNIGYKTNGLFERIGVDFNLRKKKPDSKPSNNLFIAGLRLGRSSFNYNINNVTITDDYWGVTSNFNFPTQNTTKIWYEIVIGVQVEVINNFYMGWTLRNKNLISQDISGEVAPWYIPGFGQNNGTNWGFNYTLGYHFLPQKKNLKNNKTLLEHKKIIK